MHNSVGRMVIGQKSLDPIALLKLVGFIEAFL